MARLAKIELPLRGWVTIRPPALVRSGEAQLLRNVHLTDNSIRRRNGRQAAYATPTGSLKAVLTAPRYYNYAETGSLKKFQLVSYNAGINYWDQASQWNDESPAAIPGGSSTALSMPNSAGSTLYSNYGSSITNDDIDRWFQSRSWLYLWQKYSNGDDTDDTTSVPVRTQCSGSDVFLHGLVPPNSLDLDDTGHTEGAKGTASTVISQTADGSGGTPTTTNSVAMDIDLDGNVHAIVSDSAAGNGIWYGVYNGTSWSWEEVDTSGTENDHDTAYRMAIHAATDGSIHLAWNESATLDAQYARKQSGDVVWTIETISAAHNFLDMDVVYDPVNSRTHVVATTNGNELDYFFRDGSSGSWTTATLATGTNLVRYPAISLGTTANELHLVYLYDTSGAGARQLRYAKYSSGWGSVENASTTSGTGELAGIFVDSSDNVHVVHTDGSNNNLVYTTNESASWVSENINTNVTTPISGTGWSSIHVDSDGRIRVLAPGEINGNSGVIYAQKESGGSWDSELAYTGTEDSAAGVIDPDATNDITFIVDANNILYLVTGIGRDYYYVLTAEYDDLRLGESGPSTAVGVTLGYEINGTDTHTITLNPMDNRYDMTKDVTKINVYRTVKGGSSDGPFYRVGGVSTDSNGAPTGTVVDNLPDVDLLLETQLDQDKFLPPKYRTAVMWKDRLIIGNLKARDTSAADGTELDLEAGGIHKSRLRFSVAYQPDIFRANFFQDLIPDSDSGPIQKLLVHPTSDLLFVFMENDVLVLTDPTGDLVTSLSFRARNIANASGTPAPNSVVFMNGRIFYWTKWGIEVIEGIGARSITDNTIGNLWNRLDHDINDDRYADRINIGSIDKVCGIADPMNNRIYWAYPSGTSSSNDAVLVLDVRQWERFGGRDGVFVQYSGWDISTFTRWDGEGDRGEIFGGGADSANAPWIYRIDFSDLDHVGNNGGGVTNASFGVMNVNPGETDLGYPGLKKWKRLWVEAAGDTNSDVDLKISLDNAKYQATLESTLAWTPGSADDEPRREVRNIPRAAIAVRGAPRIRVDQGTNTTAIHPFELYSISVEVEDVRTRHRGERNT